MSTEAETLSELITEAHSAIKELRGLIKEARVASAIVEVTARKAIDEDVAAEIRAQLDKYADEMQVAIEAATNAVYERFQQVGSILLGETKTAMRAGDSMEEQALAVRKIIEERGYG